jgi:CRISPR-associated protein Csy1
MDPASFAGLLRDARAAIAQGEPDRAQRIACAILAQHSGHPDALAVLANAAIASGDTAGAIDALERLRQLAPQDPGLVRSLAAAHNRAGSGHRRAGDEAGALTAFERALQLVPGHPEAGFNAALSLFALQRPAEALDAIARHLQHHPDDAEAAVLAAEWQAAHDPEAASAALDRVLTLPTAARVPRAALARAAARAGRAALALDALRAVAPEAQLALANDVGDALRAHGLVDAAAQAGAIGYRASGEGARSPGLRTRLLALALPPVMHSVAAIDADRERLARQLAELDVEWTPTRLARCAPALEQLAWGNFHLAYHGRNDRDLQRAYGRLLERAAATFAPALAEPPCRHGTRRVGLLSSCWRECTVGTYFGGWIDWLRTAGYEVHLYQLGPHRDATTETLAARASAFHFHRGDLLSLAAQVRADALDLLIYPELGMDARLWPLAALRLAARQAVAWGHPVSTGLETMDGYFTCAEMEAADAPSHYVERLLPLPGLGVAHARAPRPPPATRAELGLPEGVPLVLLPHSLFKLHPDSDTLFAGVAARVPEARFVLFDGEHPAWRPQYQARLGRAFAAHGLDPARHLLWLPKGPRRRFLQLNRACDLMLDGLHWSGGNTSLDALDSGLPLATCAGATMRARQSAAMLRCIGLDPDLVCSDPLALEARAAGLLRDPDRRAGLRTRIEAGREALFEADQARARFLEHVDGLCTADATS